MRQLPLARLTLGPALQSADPPAIHRMASACAASARGLQAQAGALDSLSARLQAGWWLSPAGTTFVHTAAEQARRVRVAAGLAQQLGGALSSLAVQLSAARADALAAVVRGRQLDVAAAELNDRLRAQHALLPQDPDSLLVSEQQAADVISRTQLATGELANAESLARQAWRHARAAFDLVGYATPGMRRRMETGAWDPAASVVLAATTTATTCGPMEELALPANGVITGPDGRPYDLIVQTTRGADGRLLVSTQEEPTVGDDWRELDVRYGTTSYGRKAATWEKVAVGFGGTAGMSYPEGSTFAPSLLGQLRVMPGGGAYLPAAVPAPAGHPVKEASAEPPRGKESHLWTAPRTGLAGGRRAAAPDGVGLIDGGISGFLLAGRLDDGRAAGYRIVFEESETGLRRARMQLYRVLSAPDEPPSTVAAGGYVDADGHLAGIPVTGEPVQRHPIITEPGH